ncbi:hypothetical protein THRCLA_09683 [Thraustotheca clavata]|uniref:Uncharacterized protein n=1 Tax=Thraustotheca clavata TaxID=74557 RepID=A0A1V9YVG9_9STRA|nr:hypothetical protein THRCLA_09683 [Thraustotheca clavata]
MTYCVTTKTPFIMTFDGMMMIMDTRENAIYVDDDAYASEPIVLEHAGRNNKLHRGAPTSLWFGDVVYLCSKRKKRYLSGKSMSSQLIWSAQCSTKAMFRIVSPQHFQGPVELQDQFSLVSVQWPHCVVGCAKSSKKLVLRRHVHDAIEFLVVDARHREYALSMLYRQRNPSIPIVYVSQDAFTIDLTPAADTVTAFAVVHS